MATHITDEQMERLDQHTKKWIQLALRTGATDEPACEQAVKDLYAYCGLSEPEVIVCDSPVQSVMVFAIAVAMREKGGEVNLPDIRYLVRKKWSERKSAKQVCEHLGGKKAWSLAKDWQRFAHFPCHATCCFYTALQEIFNVDLKSIKPLVDATILGGMQMCTDKLCVVSNYPVEIHGNEQGQPHNESGPAYLWGDGVACYYINGIELDEQIIMRPESQTIEQINKDTNTDRRSIRISRMGWPTYIKKLNADPIDSRDNPVTGAPEILYSLPMGKRLVMGCQTGRLFTSGVPQDIITCEEAQHWLASGGESRIKVNVIGAT